jgi:hypothetical protein
MLLQIVEMTGDLKGTPLFVELPVPETAPYLITSNKGLLWINSSFSGVVRSALLRVNWATVQQDTFCKVVRAVQDQGIELRWGNVLPYTESGVAEARAYLLSYGFKDVELLVSSITGAPGEVLCPFIPRGCAVLVPKDRAYLGTVSVWGTDVYTVVVHNPSRGMAILGAW